MSGTMMACGCVSVGDHMNAHDGLPVLHPTCMTHSCCAVGIVPDLTGRVARCTYYDKNAGPKGGRGHNESRTCGGMNKCMCEQPSAITLAFFEFRGEGSREARLRCRCGHYEPGHWPEFEVTFNVDREWYGRGRITDGTGTRLSAPDEITARAAAERWADQRLRSVTQGDTRVYSAELVKVQQKRPNTGGCQSFTPMGPAPFDRYYCGCHGWD